MDNTSCTNADLKRLKNEFSHIRFIGIEDLGEPTEDSFRLSSILARLEAAEAYAEYECSCDMNTTDKSLDCKCPELREAWRNSKGE